MCIRDRFKPDYLAFSPNNKMPAIIDHAPADGGEPISVFESGAILLYLANKAGRFFGTDTRQKVAVNPFSYTHLDVYKRQACRPCGFRRRKRFRRATQRQATQRAGADEGLQQVDG